MPRGRTPHKTYYPGQGYGNAYPRPENFRTSYPIPVETTKLDMATDQNVHEDDEQEIVGEDGQPAEPDVDEGEAYFLNYQF